MKKILKEIGINYKLEENLFKIMKFFQNDCLMLINNIRNN